MKYCTVWTDLTCKDTEGNLGPINRENTDIHSTLGIRDSAQLPIIDMALTMYSAFVQSGNSRDYSNHVRNE